MRFSLKKEAWRCVTLVCLHHKIMIYYKNIAKWRPSWISLGGRKSWTNWPIPINLIFFSLSQHAAKNDTKYDYTFLKMEKNIFLLNALSGHFGFWKVADPRGVSNQFFFTYSWIIYKKGTFERQCAFVGHILKINIHPYLCFIAMVGLPVTPRKADVWSDSSQKTWFI